MTKTEMMMKANINAYNNSTDYTIFHAYNKPSPRKIAIFNECLETMRQFNGYGLKIVRHNCYVFSAAFLFVDIETGVIKFAYIAPSKLTICDY